MMEFTKFRTIYQWLSERERRPKVAFYITVIIAVVFSILFIEPKYKDVKVICRKVLLEDERIQCRASCENGSFSLWNSMECHPWLTCEDIEKDVVMKRLLVKSTVKNVYLAEWKGHAVIVSELQNSQFQEDFDHNLHVLRTLSPSRFLVQLLGYCNRSVVITEYHQQGSAINVQDLLETKFSKYNTVSFRLGLCISYVSILNFFHNGSGSVRVMCDSSTLEKTLSQYLLTEDLQLAANDVDALPELNRQLGGVVCGHRELFGGFVAPEQRWPYEDNDFDSALMPPYDEKSDIWKVPEVCEWFLGKSNDADVAKYRLFGIHRRCKEMLPALRPSALEIHDEYVTILKRYQN